MTYSLDGITQRFPRCSKYELRWMLDNEMGPNVLWMLEDLVRFMDLRSGMKVLDMGCGRAISSIFLAREFGVQVWATDLWISASDNLKRIREAGADAKVFPIHAEARALPYAHDFFDAIISIDSYQYYGTDDLYLNYFIQFLKPGAQLGLVMPGLQHEFSTPPEHLQRKQSSGAIFWSQDCWSFHTPEWWRSHFLRSGSIELDRCEPVEDGCQLWQYWEELRDGKGHTGFPSEAEALRADNGEFLNFVRLIARRKSV